VYIARLDTFLGHPTHAQLLVYVAAGFISLVVLANCCMLFSQFLMARYSFRLGGEISTRLYSHYIGRDVLFHNRTNSALLIQRVMRDATTLSSSMIAPALRLNARVFSIVLLSGAIVYVEPLVALTTLLLLGAIYLVIFRVVRGVVYRNGKKISLLGRNRNRLLNESFGGIRDVKLYSLERDYLAKYQVDTKQADRATADNLVLGEFPYFFVEIFVFTGMALLTLYLYTPEAGLGSALPVLTLYALAGVKLVPKVQQSYLAITRIRGAQAAFNFVYEGLRDSVGGESFLEEEAAPLVPRSSIELRDVSFAYDDAPAPVFSNFSVSFAVGRITAVTGSSGAGKSTLLDVLTGLIEPDAGHIVIDGKPLQHDDLPAWRATIGFVPQDVYLTDTTPAENIAFGVAPAEIDMARVQRAAQLAHIHDFIETLPDGYHSPIGERGAQFSGGQRQRIGLARAFYRQVSVLILDEATSALDNATQEEILQSLKQEQSGLTVIMVTHRQETMAIADHVVQLGAESSPECSHADA
ncbi:MAG: ABC transporter ATP-binding protein, partial [Halioglobus sp.]|nr:ABC transporter ATP-binding protein [Halioglobus sp.]